MDDQSKTSELACQAEPRNLVNDPQLRLHCLELASRLGEGSAHDTVVAAQDYLNFVAGAPLYPPMKGGA